MNSDSVESTIEATLRDAVKEQYSVELSDLISEKPPNPTLGDIAFPVAFELAKHARMAPRKIAEQLARSLEGVAGVESVEVAGAGYLNVFLNRRDTLASFFANPDPKPNPKREKYIVEHTAINPNKAAHIGHLRNAALGDSFVRILRYSGEQVEIQNYIDDTGVQVADVVVGFLHLRKVGLDEVRQLAKKERFDYSCWDLYASVSDFYAEDETRLKLREQTLKALEEGSEPEASLADFIARTIVRCHLVTMRRLDVRYDLLPWEGDILRLRFWDRAFELMKDNKVIRLADAGKHAGCWVMDLEDPSLRQSLDAAEPQATDQEQRKEEDASPIGDTDTGDHDSEKVIVRSNGIVTYVGKDIAYQMWKLGLLGKDFNYTKFYEYDDGHPVWASTIHESEPGAPSFGSGTWVYNVIDVRQAYPQLVVQQGVAKLATEEARERSSHFAYEMVALTPATCKELGFPVSKEEEVKPYLEVSGRKGLGVKADDLLDTLAAKALPEVSERNQELDEVQQKEIAGQIAVGALRYFMIKTTKNKVIAFDFSEALSFKGDSGPYLQYSAVRAAKILEKIGLTKDAALSPEQAFGDWDGLDEGVANDCWSLLRNSMDLSAVCSLARRSEEPAHLANFALQQAQQFSKFYARHNIAREENPKKKALLTLVVQVFRRQQVKTLSLLGIPVPERM